MAKLNLSSQISAQVADLFNKALTNKSATNLMGLRITVDPTEILPVDIKGSNTSALLGWTNPGEEAREIWASWLTRRGTSAETGEVFSNKFIIDDEPVFLSPEKVIEIIVSQDLLLENVEYHMVVEATFSSTGQRTGEKEMRRPFFTWQVLPRREVPAKDEWSQEILDRISKNDPAPSTTEEEQQPTKKTTTKRSSKKAVSKDGTSFDVPF